jgi:hypothetical protein
MAIDYNSPAELFLPKPKGGGGRRPIGYRRFATAAEAIRFAVEEFPAVRTLGAWYLSTMSNDRKLHGLKSDDWSTICLKIFAVSTMSSGDTFISNVSQSKIKFPSLVM